MSEDYYNNPGVYTEARFSAIKSEFLTVAFACGFQILLAFGSGSFSNNCFQERLIRHDYDPKPDPARLVQRVNMGLGLNPELPRHRTTMMPEPSSKK